jgi:hypothetical protein
MLEVPLSRELDGPFLVSSSKGFIWIADKFPSGVVRVAPRHAPVLFLFREALYEIAKMSRENEWGSFHPPTLKGVKAAVDHLAGYEFEEVEVLYGEGFNTALLPKELPRHEEVWVPKNWAVVLPTEKAYVGTAFDFATGQAALVVHNASRGVGIISSGMTSVQDLVLTQRTLKALAKGVKGKPIHNMEDLLLYTRSELLTIKGFGEGSLKEVEEALSTVKMKLPGTRE